LTLPRKRNERDGGKSPTDTQFVESAPRRTNASPPNPLQKQKRIERLKSISISDFANLGSFGKSIDRDIEVDKIDEGREELPRLKSSYSLIKNVKYKYKI